MSDAENRAQIREARMKGKSSGFKTGILAALAAGLATTVALNKAGVNVSDKATEAFDKTVDKVKKVAADSKKKLEEKKAASEKE